jgi:multisubunit Na+/H+ antiporter MnhE subunit
VSDLSSRDARRPQQPNGTFARRAGIWLAWWVLLMSLWVIADDSIRTDELLAGSAAAAVAALLAELAGHQAATRPSMRAAWLRAGLRLPAEVLRDTWTVFAALWRRLAHGDEPPSGFREIPVRAGALTPAGATRRALLVGGRSVAPNTFVLGIDGERGVMVVHQLVAADRGGRP